MQISTLIYRCPWVCRQLAIVLRSQHISCLDGLFIKSQIDSEIDYCLDARLDFLRNLASATFWRFSESPTVMDFLLITSLKLPKVTKGPRKPSGCTKSTRCVSVVRRITGDILWQAQPCLPHTVTRAGCSASGEAAGYGGPAQGSDERLAAVPSSESLYDKYNWSLINQ
jgi:hypothetical protein